MLRFVNHWRTCLLGVLGGVFSSGFCWLAYRIDEYYLELREAAARALVTVPSVCGGVFRSPFWWTCVAGLHIALYVAATLIAYRFLSKRATSVFILWQYIGLFVFAAWGLLMVLETIPQLLDGSRFHVISPVSPAGWKVTAVAFAANVVYGTAIHVFARSTTPWNEIRKKIRVIRG